MHLIQYKLSDIPRDRLRVLGRTNGRLDPLTLFYNASGIEMNVSGSELWVDLHVDCTVFEPWLDIVINGARTQRIMLTPENKRVCVYRNLGNETVRNIRILRDTQPMADDPKNLLEITGIEASGDTEFAVLTPAAMRIEFIGDSLTTGEGLCGSTVDDDWGPQCMDSIPNYTFMTAQDLGAEYRVYSLSGWGVYVSWRNDPRENIPRYYTKLCGMLPPAYASLGAMEDWNFADWQPDVVVVNLGANDAFACDMPACVDPDTGLSRGMHTLADGSMDPADVRTFEEAVCSFLRLLREKNPKARILWAYGMLAPEGADRDLAPAIRAAVLEYRNGTGDEGVEFIELPETIPGEFGARSHPGVISHRHTADVLVKRIREIQG